MYVWRPGLARTRWESLSAPPDSLAAVKESYFYGEGVKGGREGRRKGGKGKEGERGKGREERDVPP